MKTFKDLRFRQHPAYKDLRFRQHPAYPVLDSWATMNFKNGYGVSVITGSNAYSSKKAPYEVAILYNDELCYTTSISDDVIGYCTEERVTEIMKQVQELKD